MQKFLALPLLSLALSIAACTRTTPDVPGGGEPPVWVEQDLQHAGTSVSLGYRADPDQSDSVEPVTRITRDGQPVADAMVFNSLVADGNEVTGEEMATVYEMSSDRKTAHYAQGKLPVPPGGTDCQVRFRVVLPGVEQDWVRDVAIPVK